MERITFQTRWRHGDKKGVYSTKSLTATHVNIHKITGIDNAITVKIFHDQPDFLGPFTEVIAITNLAKPKANKPFSELPQPKPVKSSTHVFVTVRGFRGTDEWRMKEYGSWEDRNCPEDHACALIARLIDTPAKKIEFTIEHAQTLLKSIDYHCSAGWDGFESALESASIHRTWRSYRDELRKLLQSN